MVSLGHVALDGTKVQANASKHKATSACSRPKSSWMSADNEVDPRPVFAVA